MKSILDREFRYVPSFETDVRKTFERVQREQRAALEQRRAEVRLVEFSAAKRSRPPS